MQRLGELGGVAAEASVVAGEGHRVCPQALGQARGTVGQLPLGLSTMPATIRAEPERRQDK